MIAITLGIILVSLLAYIVHLARDVNQRWKRKGLKYLEPLLFVGNTLPVLLKKKPVCDIYTELCNKFPDEPILGFYDLMTPRIIVQDSEYIEKILIKDFQHFTDHGFAYPDEEKDPIDHYQLFSLRGTKWRAFRYKMSPLFTSGKLKQFYEALDHCGDRIMEYINKHPKNDVDLTDMMQLFISDFVGMAVFGFDVAVIDNPDSEFHKMGKNIFDLGLIKQFFVVMAPQLGEKLGLTFGKKKTIDYFCKVIQEAFAHREKTGLHRKDFIQMMIQLKEKRKIEVQMYDPKEEVLNGDVPTETFEVTDASLMSQAYTFMTTGLDTVSVSLAYLFYELSIHQDIQKKVREDILEQIKLHKGVTYDSLKSMTYLENAVNESQRLHPIIIALFRICTKDYTFPNGFKINEGEILHIPVHTIHKSTNYHNDPLEFKPERFDYPMKPGTYIPFGDGPRVCIAMRFALLQVKYAVAKVLSSYNVTISPKTKLPLRLKPGPILVTPAEPLYFDLTEIK